MVVIHREHTEVGKRRRGRRADDVLVAAAFRVVEIGENSQFSPHLLTPYS